MAVPTVNVTCTVTNQTGAVVAGATVTAQLTALDVYGTNYIFPSVQTFVTDVNGFVTMPLFPNALGARRTAYLFKAIDPVTGRPLINITAIVPNQNIDLSVLDAIGQLPAYAPPLTQPYSMTLASLASLGVVVGSILFGGPGQSVLQDSANLFWDNTNKRLGIGNAAPSVALDVTGAAKVGGTCVIAGNFQVLSDVAIFGGVGADSATKILVRGTAQAIRLGTSSGLAAIEAVDNTGSASYQPLAVNGSTVAIGIAGTARISIAASGAVTIPVSVATPQIIQTADAALVFKTNNLTAWQINGSAAGYAFTPAQDNGQDFGSVGNRVHSGHFGTSVVTPLVQSASTVFTFGSSGATWGVIDSAGSLRPTNDNTQQIGLATNRVSQVFTSIIDSGTTGSLSLKTNNGQVGLIIRNSAGTPDTFFQFASSTGGNAYLNVTGATNANANLLSKGTGNIGFWTGGADDTSGSLVQLQVLHTASASRNITVTGSNGGNPVLNTTAGGVDISPATVRFPNIGTTAVAANATLNAVGSNDLLRSTSSKRYKTEIEALSRDEAVALLRKLSPVTYASICEQDDPWARHSGFIAEDVHAINPLFVSFSKDDKGNKRPESVQYERLTVPLVAGWQDHETRLAALEARIH